MNCTLYGRLTKDAEIVTTTGGTTLAKFGVAENWKFKDKEGVSFFDCIAFGKTGEAINKYLKKGDPILIFGDQRQQTWQDQEGKKHYKFEIAVNSFKFVGQKKDAQTQDTTSYDSMPPAFPTDPSDPPVYPDAEGEIPF